MSARGWSASVGPPILEHLAVTLVGEALDAGDIQVEGDLQAVERFLGLFPLPAPAA